MDQQEFIYGLRLIVLLLIAVLCLIFVIWLSAYLTPDTKTAYSICTEKDMIPIFDDKNKIVSCSEVK